MGFVFIPNLFDNKLGIKKTLRYFILSSFASQSLVMRVSYSASLFEVLKSNQRAYFVTTPFRLVRMSPTLHPWTFKAPTCRIQWGNFLVSSDLVEDKSSTSSDLVEDGPSNFEDDSSSMSLDLIEDRPSDLVEGHSSSGTVHSTRKSANTWAFIAGHG